MRVREANYLPSSAYLLLWGGRRLKTKREIFRPDYNSASVK
jgi:hypothetical protein